MRGSVLGATLTRLAPISAQDLVAVDPVKWRETRSRLKQRHHAWVLRSRFRRNPAAYLAALKQHAFQQLAWHRQVGGGLGCLSGTSCL